MDKSHLLKILNIYTIAITPPSIDNVFKNDTSDYYYNYDE